MTVSDAPPIGGLETETTRKAEWGVLNRLLLDHCQTTNQDYRHVAMLSKLYFVPEGKAVHTPTIWVRGDKPGTYRIADKEEPYVKIVTPNEQNRLVCDNAFNRHEYWCNAAFWWEATRTLGLRRNEQHLNDLVEKKHTFWGRGHWRDTYMAVQLTDVLADQVNRVGIENGSVAPWMVDPKKLHYTMAGWEFELVQPKPHKARAGDWLCTRKTESEALYLPGEFPYNRARVFPQAFCDERMRFIDELL